MTLGLAYIAPRQTTAYAAVVVPALLSFFVLASLAPVRLP